MISKNKLKTILIVLLSVMMLGMFLSMSYDVYHYIKMNKKITDVSDVGSYTLSSKSSDNFVGKVNFSKKKTSDKIVMDKVSKIVDKSREISDGDVQLISESVVEQPSDKSFKELYLEYGQSILGKDAKCQTDLEHESKNYQRCLSRLEVLISNSDNEYKSYTDNALKTLYDDTNLQLDILKKLSSKSGDKNYQKIIGYLKDINDFKLENLNELDGLNSKVGKISYEDMNKLMESRKYNYKYIYKTEINLLQQLNNLSYNKGIV